MNIRVETPPAPVEPGATAAGSIHVLNDSSIVESYRLEVVGADGWVTAEPAEVSLFPGQEAVCGLVVRAPRSPAVAAGTHRVGVRVVGTSTAAATVEEVDVEVAPFEAVTMALRPATARARRRARFTALVTNNGNVARRYWFAADDADDLLRFRARPTHAHLEPGESRLVRIAGTFLSRTNPGDRVPVRVTAGNDSTSTEERATVAVRATRGLAALVVAAGAAAVAAIVLLSAGRGAPTSSATAGVFATTTAGEPRRATPTSAADSGVTTTAPPPTTAAPGTTVATATTTVPAPTTAPPATTVAPPRTTSTSTSTSTTTSTSTGAASPITVIRFDTPAPLKGQRDQLLAGDEFAARGITVAGVPSTSTFCPTATQAALLATNQFGAPSPFLSTATPTDVRQCNNVPLGIHFAQPVKRVKLTIWGASVDYRLIARNAKGAVVAQATVRPQCCSATSTVEVKGSLVTDVTYGLDKAITAVTQIEYEV